MKIEELQYLEMSLCDHVSEVFDAMPDAGGTEWDLRKLDLINRVMAELSNIVVEVG